MKLANMNELDKIGVKSLEDIKSAIFNTIKSHIFTYISAKNIYNYDNLLDILLNDEGLKKEYLESSKNYNNIVYNTEDNVEELFKEVIEEEIPDSTKENYDKILKYYEFNNRIEQKQHGKIVLDKKGRPSELFSRILKFKKNFKTSLID